MPDLWSAPAKQCQERAGTGSRTEKVGQTVGSLGEFHGFYPGLIEQDGAFEDIHRWGVEPRAKIHVTASILDLALDDGGGSLARQPCRVQQIVILEHPHRTGPLECGQCGFNRAAERIVEGQQPRRLAGPEDEMGEAFRTIGEGADDDGLRGGHRRNIVPRSVGGYGTSSDFGSTRTIHSPELMSGT